MPRVTDSTKVAYPILLQPQLGTDANGNPIWVQLQVNQGGVVAVVVAPPSAPAWPT